MSKDICIHAWSCSYYLNTEKRWVSGQLSLTPVTLKFTADKSGELLVNFHLSCINDIKKESSSVIFSSITILEKEQTKHWFSSLQPNRNVVFTVIEHFWREQLLAPREAEGQAAFTQSNQGKELINLALGSQRRLEDTARVLQHQGEQFDHIMKGLDKIDSDMDVADRLLTELDSSSWWPFSSRLRKTVPDTRARETTPVSNPTTLGREGVIITVPIIFSYRTDVNLKPGKLIVLVSALELQDSSSQLVHRYEREEVDDVKVHTPYEISVRQRFIGKPDICYRLLSARMFEVIAILEMQYKKKIEFGEDALVFSARQSPQDDASTSIWQSAAFINNVVQPTTSSGGAGQSQLQAERQTVSEAETQELKQILMKLKCLALEAETELERQDEALDAIGTSTDRATLNIDKQNRRMRKLL
ncbi:synaptosomal-associated protein 47 [Microcaecilia unicolor]|uniref:Synaptosomal-associated protein 47 n=1 Tax=Microcaecilia unicolor TaxID=1415580 RepID=A0A6P7XC24_9AMPH|nr:synaptosomal-associated protein 47 [Microcaecilia unicolor]XP_030053132.1 synaptosomal-associated protein 47 [Microcaecilia unicolor]